MLRIKNEILIIKFRQINNLIFLFQFRQLNAIEKIKLSRMFAIIVTKRIIEKIFVSIDINSS